jgi:mRNA-degrading endonuclease toxin of MazEF toxin-antitoxin module
MVVVSKEDSNAPRALAVCVPVTTVYRESLYEVPLPRMAIFREQSYANVQGLQAIQHHELVGPVGRVNSESLDKIKSSIRFAIDLK